MIFMATVCPKAIKFATAESIHHLLALRPHPSIGISRGNSDALEILLFLHDPILTNTQFISYNTFLTIWTLVRKQPCHVFTLSCIRFPRNLLSIWLHLYVKNLIESNLNYEIALLTPLSNSDQLLPTCPT